MIFQSGACTKALRNFEKSSNLAKNEDKASFNLLFTHFLVDYGLPENLYPSLYTRICIAKITTHAIRKGE